MSDSTTQAETLSALIARLEASTGPDREIDQAVADATLIPESDVCIVGAPAPMKVWRYIDGSVGTALRCTASLDAAMTLVPDGHLWTIKGRMGGVEWSASCWATGAMYVAYCEGCYAATPALALSAAALRARLDLLSAT